MPVSRGFQSTAFTNPLSGTAKILQKIETPDCILVAIFANINGMRRQININSDEKTDTNEILIKEIKNERNTDT